MNSRKIHLIFWCIAAGLIAYLVLDFWSQKTAPLYMKLERQWEEDVVLLEKSGKIHPSWFEVKEVELYGGTPLTRNWLKRIKIPIKPKKEKDGTHKLEVLVVEWEEDGIRGAMIQYNLVDLQTKNMIWELSRNLYLSRPRDKDPFKALMEDLRQ